MSKEIKPCPSCGGGSTIATDANRRAFFVACTGSCMMEGPYTEARDEAIAKWNRLHMLPEGAAGDFGEPWRIVRQGPWPERIEDRAHCDPLRPRHGHMDRAVECINALASLNPEALGEFVEAAKAVGTEPTSLQALDRLSVALAWITGDDDWLCDPAGEDDQAKVDALAKLKGEG